jgi:hypothetical protein
MSATSNPSRSNRWLVGGLLLVGLVVGATVIAKYRLIEPMAYAAACERHEGPWLGCLLRQTLVVLFVKNIAGMAATLFGVWSTVTRSRGLAFAAIAMGGISMVLYRFDSAVIGVLLGLLVLAREAARRYQQAAGESQGEPREA